MRNAYEQRTKHKRNDGKPLFLSFYEAMLYTDLDRCMLEFVLLYHIRLSRRESRRLTLETLHHAQHFAKLYDGVPPGKLADVITFSRRRGRPAKRAIPIPQSIGA